MVWDGFLIIAKGAPALGTANTLRKRTETQVNAKVLVFHMAIRIDALATRYALIARWTQSSNNPSDSSVRRL